MKCCLRLSRSFTPSGPAFTRVVTHVSPVVAYSTFPPRLEIFQRFTGQKCTALVGLLFGSSMHFPRHSSVHWFAACVWTLPQTLTSRTYPVSTAFVVKRDDSYSKLIRRQQETLQAFIVYCGINLTKKMTESSILCLSGKIFRFLTFATEMLYIHMMRREAQ